MFQRIHLNFISFLILIISFLSIQPNLFAKTKSSSFERTAYDTKALNVDQREFSLAVGIPVLVQILDISSFDLGKLQILDCKDFCNTTKQTDGKIVFELNPRYFNIKNEKKEVTLIYSAGETKYRTTLSILINARITEISKIDTAKIEMVEGQEKTLPASPTYKVDGVVKNSYAVVANDYIDIPDKTKFIAKKAGSTKLAMMSDTDKSIALAEIPIQILSAINSIELKSTDEIVLTENKNLPLNIIAKDSKGNSIKDLSRVECKVDSPTPTYLDINKRSSGFTFAAKPVAGKEQTAKVVCKVSPDKKNGGDKDGDLLSFNVRIIPREGYLTVENVGGNTLLPNGVLSFFVRIFKLDGLPSNGGIEYDFENDTDSQWISLNKQGQKLIVNWVDLPSLDEKGKPKERRPQFVKVNVRANLSDSSKLISDTITIHMAQVTRFDALKVKLNLMDNRTVSDLYGSVTNDEYYVLMLRLFNDLKESETNKSQGESILAYSSSIEIAVGLEKQYDRDSKAGNLGVFTKDQMKIIQTERSGKLFDDFQENLKTLDNLYKEQLKTFNAQMKIAFEKDTKAHELEIDAINDSSKAEAAKKARDEASQAFQTASNISDKLNNIYRMNILSTPKTPTPDAPIADGKWYPATRNDLLQARMDESDFLSVDKNDDLDSTKSNSDGEPTCIDTITYRPFTFEMMVNTVDRRNERSVKSSIFKILNFLALGATTVTAVAVPGKGSDLPVGLEKYGNFLIPGLEKLFPSYKEQYRQNIVSQMMKPIEEIPFGSDITRVIFIPKKSIKGLIIGHNARISQVCPFYFKIKVAVVSKGGDVTLGGQK
jgi:hypothetical protein